MKRDNIINGPYRMGHILSYKHLRAAIVLPAIAVGVSMLFRSFFVFLGSPFVFYPILLLNVCFVVRYMKIYDQRKAKVENLTIDQKPLVITREQLKQKMLARPGDVYIGRGFEWCEHHTQDMHNFTPMEKRQLKEKNGWDEGTLLHGIGRGEEHDVYIPARLLRQSTLFQANPGYGKTRAEEVIATQCIYSLLVSEKKHGVWIIQPKGDLEERNTIFSECILAGRKEDYILHSPAHSDKCATTQVLASYDGMSSVTSIISGLAPGRGEDAGVFKGFINHYSHSVLTAMKFCGMELDLPQLLRNLSQDMAALAGNTYIRAVEKAEQMVDEFPIEMLETKRNVLCFMSGTHPFPHQSDTDAVSIACGKSDYSNYLSRCLNQYSYILEQVPARAAIAEKEEVLLDVLVEIVGALKEKLQGSSLNDLQWTVYNKDYLGLKQELGRLQRTAANVHEYRRIYERYARYTKLVKLEQKHLKDSDDNAYTLTRQIVNGIEQNPDLLSRLIGSIKPILTQLSTEDAGQTLCSKKHHWTWKSILKEGKVLYLETQSMKDPDVTKATISILTRALASYVGYEFSNFKEFPTFNVLSDELIDVVNEYFASIAQQGRAADVRFYTFFQTDDGIEQALGSQAAAQQLLKAFSTKFYGNLGYASEELQGFGSASIITEQTGVREQPGLPEANKDMFSVTHTESFATEKVPLVDAGYVSRLNVGHWFARIGKKLYKLRTPMLDPDRATLDVYNYYGIAYQDAAEHNRVDQKFSDLLRDAS